MKTTKQTKQLKRGKRKNRKTGYLGTSGSRPPIVSPYDTMENGLIPDGMVRMERRHVAQRFLAIELKSKGKVGNSCRNEEIFDC
jgi:hypothetical protein